jgi:pyrroline-5-carboxylate reductase
VIDLDPSCLRHDEAHDLVDFAHALFDATGGVIEVRERDFEAVWAAAGRPA